MYENENKYVYIYIVFIFILILIVILIFLKFIKYNLQNLYFFIFSFIIYF